jgi:hypothetical protein
MAVRHAARARADRARGTYLQYSQYSQSTASTLGLTSRPSCCRFHPPPALSCASASPSPSPSASQCPLHRRRIQALVAHCATTATAAPSAVGVRFCCFCHGFVLPPSE